VGRTARGQGTDYTARARIEFHDAASSLYRDPQVIPAARELDVVRSTYQGGTGDSAAA
jgi:hypothetical protein